MVTTFFDYATYWPAFPIWVLIATTAMATGIDWAIFWAPVLIFWFGLPPEIAIACWIFIEIFGFWSWVYSYILRWKILFKEVMPLLIYAIWFWLLWAIASKLAPKALMYFLLASSTLFLAYNNFKRCSKKNKKEEDKQLSDIEFPTIKYLWLWKVLNSIWWFLTWIIWVWLWEVNNYFFLEKNKLSIPYASWNSVFLIAFTAFVCSIFNIFWFWSHPGENDFIKIYSIIIFAVPSVVIWARLGSILAHKINPKVFYFTVWVLFLWICILNLYHTYILL